MPMKAGGCAVHSLPYVPRCGRVALPSGFVAVYLYRSHPWPCRVSDALPRGGGFRLIIRGGWCLYLYRMPCRV